MRGTRLLLRMQPVPPIDGEAVAAQLGEAGDAPDVGRDVELLLEQDGGGLDLAQDVPEPRSCTRCGDLGARAQQVHAAADAFLHLGSAG